MGEVGAHIYIITVCLTFLWVAFFYGLYRCFRYILKGSAKERAIEAERARLKADRRG